MIEANEGNDLLVTTIMHFFHALDAAILTWLNQFVGRAPKFDTLIRLVADWHFVRSFWLICFLWWIWFARRDAKTRLKILAGVCGIALATAISKIMQLMIFVHVRPFAAVATTGLSLPANLPIDWGFGSCFPSDTSALHFAIAATIASVSRRWGIAAFVWVAAVIAIPRIYLLYHYPSDVVAALVLSIVCVTLVQRNKSILNALQRSLLIERVSPQLFYPIFFLCFFQITDSFDVFDKSLRYTKNFQKSIIRPAPGAFQ